MTPTLILNIVVTVLALVVIAGDVRFIVGRRRRERLRRLQQKRLRLLLEELMMLTRVVDENQPANPCEICKVYRNGFVRLATLIAIHQP